MFAIKKKKQFVDQAARFGIGRDEILIDGGSGSERRSKVTATLISMSNNPVVYIERNEARRAKAESEFGGAVRTVSTPVGRLPILRRAGLLYLDVTSENWKETFLDVLPVARELVREEGVIALNVPTGFAVHEEGLRIEGLDCRRRQDELLYGKLVSKLSRDSLSGMRVLGRSAALHSADSGFLCCTYFVSIGFDHTKVVESLGINELRYFQFDGLKEHLERLSSSVNIIPPEEFVLRRERGNGSTQGNAAHCIKHDIHHDLLAAIRFARAEESMKVRGIYFFMPQHHLTRDYFSDSNYDEVIDEIRGRGHTIGVHVDTLELAGRGEGFEVGLMEFVQRLRKLGVVLRFGNTHGNSALSAAGVNPTHVFEEVSARCSPPPSDCNRLRGRFSLMGIFKHLGIEYWFDTAIFRAGRAMSHCRVSFTDNYRRFDVYSYSESGNQEDCIFEGGQWLLDHGVSSSVIEATRRDDCVHLFHPQFYR